LLVALTVTPALALLLLQNTPLHEEPKLLTRLKDAHEALLRRLCAKPAIAVAATLIMGVVTIGSFFLFGAELLPAFRERHYVLALNGPPGASIDWMRNIGGHVTHDLLAIPGVATVEQQIGRAAAGEDTWPPNRSEFHVELGHVSGAQEEEILARIRAVLDSYPGVQTEALTFLGDRIGESLSGETAAVAIGIYGPDLDVLDRVGTQVAAALSRVPGAADVQVKSPPATPIVQVSLDPTRLGLGGLSTTDAYDSIEATFQGQTVAQVTDGQRLADVAIVTPREGSNEPETAGSLLVQGANSGAALGAVADVGASEGRAGILHDGGRRRQVVTANPTTSDVTGFVARARAEISRSVQLPPGVYLEYSGVAEGQAAATRQVLVNVAVAAVAVVALLLLAFGDGRATTLILSGTPFALAGGALGVALIGGVLSLGALVGFVTLFGIAARNAILLVSHADNLVDVENEPWGLETVLRATSERVTPILMTALVTALGLLPLALGTGEAGREVQGPMAVVILGGLISSTIMSLVLAPPLILAYRRRREPIEEPGRPASSLAEA
jgi:Cu/Ag efflux pump CusA